MQEQKDIKKLIGRIGNDYYICDYVFKHGEGYQGATATVLCPVSKAEYEAAQEIDQLKDRFSDLWGEAARDGRTEESLEDYAQGIYDMNGDETLWDFSGHGYWDMLREAVPMLTEDDFPVFDCAGGGRSFSANMDWTELYDIELWELIKKYEIGE